MKSPLHYIKTFVRRLGPVEQAQIVASTAVIVSMTTIISAMAATGQSPRLMDFISILTVGIIGFTSVYFSLNYSRELDEQRRQLLALNMIAEAVTRVVELDYVLQTAPMVPSFETIIVEVPAPDGPYGAKGIGEGPVCGAAAAVANAVADATGVRFRELPLTPPRIWRGISARAAG